MLERLRIHMNFLSIDGTLSIQINAQFPHCLYLLGTGLGQCLLYIVRFPSSNSEMISLMNLGNLKSKI